MKKKIIGIFIGMLVIMTALPAVGTLDTDNPYKDKNMVDNTENTTPIYQNPHHVGIRIDKLYVYDDSDDPPKGDGEWYFKIYAFPKIWSYKTKIYQVTEDPAPWDLETIAYFEGVRFTPQFLLILAFDDEAPPPPKDRFDQFLGWTFIRFNPPKGDYKWPNQVEEIYTWENQFFKAVVKVYMHYGH